MMENEADLAAGGVNPIVFSEHTLEEIRTVALAAAQMRGFLAGEKIIRSALNSSPHLVDQEMASLKKAFSWNKFY